MTKQTKAILSIVISSVFLVSTNASSVYMENRGGNTIVRPFGLHSHQPPARVNIVKIDRVEIGARANQVCGYTDWSSLQLELPKKLLSKTYWENIGTPLVQQAKKTVLDFSFAIPSMLACNVSPTYCHVFNQAEMMAGFEGQLSFETCKILDEVASEDWLQHETLVQCINKRKSHSSQPSDSEAREYCLSDGGRNLSKNSNDQAHNLARNTGDTEPRFSVRKFLTELFPDNEDDNLASGSEFSEYSRTIHSKNLAHQIYRGIEVKGSVMVRHEGSYQASIENKLSENTKKTKNAVLRILKEMKINHDKGYNAKETIERSKSLWEDKQVWKQEKQPNPIYRMDFSGENPSFVISPEKIYQLLPLAKEGIDDNAYLNQIVDRMAKTTSYLKVQDMLFDILSRSMEECYGEKNRGKTGQKNCEALIERAKLSMQFLEHKMIAEERVIAAQDKISQLIESVKINQALKMRISKSSRFDDPLQPIEFPR